MKTKEKRLKQLHLRTTGGMGVTLEGSVDIDALPGDLARQIEAELTPTKLSRVARRKAVSFAPGQQEYEVTLFADAKQEPKRYAFTDQQADPELLDLLDELTTIIIKEKIQARRARKLAQTEDEPAVELDNPIPVIDEDIGADLVDETFSVQEDDLADSPLANASLG